jgi:restriction endonuclease Mrr
MEMPTHEQFRRPALEVLAHSSPLNRKQLFELVAARMALNAEQMASRLPTGELRARKHCDSALTKMYMKGLVDSLSRGLWTITNLGKSLLAFRSGVLDDEAIAALVPAIRKLLQRRYRRQSRDRRNARRWI